MPQLNHQAAADIDDDDLLVHPITPLVQSPAVLSTRSHAQPLNPIEASAGARTPPHLPLPQLRPYPPNHNHNAPIH